VFLAIYIGADPEMYRRGIMHLFPHKQRERAGEVLSGIAGVLRKWLVTQLIAMVTIGVVSTIVLALMGVKASIALGVLAGLLEFVPTVGPLISAIPAVAMGFIDSPEKALWVAIAYWGIQFFENHLLIPLLMKGGINLPPALTILAQALMALIFGFLGLMCAVPLLAATMVAVKMLYVEGVVGDPQIGPDEDPRRGVE
jgi:predicted PurR-regulated permease PerM